MAIPNKLIEPPEEKEDLRPASVTTQSFAALWRLYFKRGMNPRAEIIFANKGDKDAAIKRGREFCLRMNYKFIHVEPFLVDLVATEREFLGYPPEG